MFLIENECKTLIGCLTFIYYQKLFCDEMNLMFFIFGWLYDLMFFCFALVCTKVRMSYCTGQCYIFSKTLIISSLENVTLWTDLPMYAARVSDY